HISKDFIEQLPKSKDKDTILVVVCRFTKYGHFIPLAHPFTAATVVKPTAWAEWISLAEWWYNSFYHSAIKTTSFKTLYGYYPPLVPVIFPHKQQLDEILNSNLEVARNRIKQQADRKRSEREFHVGDWVYLKLQSYRQTSLALQKTLKLAAKFYGPFKVLERIESVAYKLDLPPASAIHPVFHVSLPKKKLGDHVVPMTELPSREDDEIVVALQAMLQTREITRGGQQVSQVLIKWKNLSPEDATWEDQPFVLAQFPEFAHSLEQECTKGRGIVTYKRTRYKKK
ncbi:hypothetical protein MANES_10G117250v8, partial [Manihot esculenta]